MVARFNLVLEKQRLGALPGSSNYVNTRKLTSVIRQKIVNSELADSSMRYTPHRHFASSEEGSTAYPVCDSFAWPGFLFWPRSSSPSCSHSEILST